MLRGLSHYRLIRPLGEGSQGRVFLALDQRLQRQVCIKIYAIAATGKARRKAVSEAWQLARVESSRVLDVYDVVANDGQLALITRYVPGCDLETLLTHEHRFSLATAVSIVSDIAAALAALRRARIVHGDLKCSNVLLDMDGRAYLADFGVAVFLGERFDGHSLESVSPEQYRGEAATLQSDFFALGLLLYQMITGSHPFFVDGEFRPQLLYGGLTALPDFAVSHSTERSAADEAVAREAVSRLLFQLLAAQPEQRPASTFALREELRALRALLPAPQKLHRLVARQTSGRASGAPLPGLPPELLRLPWHQHVQAWLRRYWQTGSPGARAMLVLLPLLPAAYMGLLMLQPGPCVGVPTPTVYVQGTRGDSLGTPQRIRAELTRVLKDAQQELVVLGAGSASDSMQVVKPTTIHDICLAQRFIELKLDCRDRCLVQLQFRDYTGERTVQMFVPEPVTPASLARALTQLVREQGPLMPVES